MAVGTVTRLVKDRGFGFIRDDDGGKEYFFHYTAVKREPGFAFDSMQEGKTRVEFEVGQSEKGLRAENVVRE